MRKEATEAALFIGLCYLTAGYVLAAPPALLDEGFEGGTMPPNGWTQSILNADYTWQVVSGGAHSGTKSAWIDWEPDPFTPQNEWLVSPALSMTEATLFFWSKGDLHWCRDLHNGCELFVWLVVGDVGGGDDIMVGRADDDWIGTDIWSQSSMDLTPFLPASTPVKIGFNYMGWADRGDVGLDDIRVVGQGGLNRIFSDGFESGDMGAWSGSVP